MATARHGHSLLQSSHGLKKPLMLANKDAIPKTVMPMMQVSGLMSPSAPSPPPRAAICTAGARKDCFSGALPAGLGVVPTKQIRAEQATAKSTQASTREAERAMLQALAERAQERSSQILSKAQAEAKMIAETCIS